VTLLPSLLDFYLIVFIYLTIFVIIFVILTVEADLHDARELTGSLVDILMVPGAPDAPARRAPLPSATSYCVGPEFLARSMAHPGPFVEVRRRWPAR